MKFNANLLLSNIKIHYLFRGDINCLKVTDV